MSGGVQLNLGDANAVISAFEAIAQRVRAINPAAFLGVTVQPMVNLEGYELILGSSIDPQFGSVMLFGSGGQLVEVFQDRSLALGPLNTTLARRMMEQTRIYKAWQGVRGRSAIDLVKLEQLLVRFSQLIVEPPQISEIDINPLLISPESAIALDARVVLKTTENPILPAIRPYPTQYVQKWSTEGDRPITSRPIRPEDEPLILNSNHTEAKEC